MSRHVKIGGIGKNPVIDKVNAVNQLIVRTLAASRMEKMICSDNNEDASQGDDTELGKIIYSKIPLTFDWEESDGMENDRTI